MHLRATNKIIWETKLVILVTRKFTQGSKFTVAILENSTKKRTFPTLSKNQAAICCHQHTSREQYFNNTLPLDSSDFHQILILVVNLCC
jgi:hypothetical protein